jgi:squalene-hopene/tetraprenyl-beta-curcumene cyclase
MTDRKNMASRVGEKIAALQEMAADLINGRRRVGVVADWNHRAHRRAPAVQRTPLDEAIHRIQQYLLRRQHPIGYWSGELVADATLSSDYIFLLHFLDERDPVKEQKLVHGILETQNPDGGWSIYEGGPSEINATVKAYVALRLCDRPPESPPLARARGRILALGGIEAVNSYSRVYLAILGAMDWKDLPALVPEIMLVPAWFPFNIYDISSWSRAIVVPLTIVYAHKPRKPYRDLKFDELRTHRWTAPKRRGFLASVFRWADKALGVYDRVAYRPVRRLAVQKALEWILERNRPAGGLGAIWPGMLNSIIALRCLGYAKESPQVRKAFREMREFEVRENGTMRMIPCFSPVWDTAWAMIALSDSQYEMGRREILGAASWLISKQENHPGDWQYNNRRAPHGGWYFEFDNAFYPDVDDTAAVLMALHAGGADRTEPGRGAFRRGLEWILTMQNDDGGWGAFDRNNNKMWLNSVPFADHNALLDPSESDITARVLELFGRIGWHPSHQAIRRGIEFIKSQQREDGSWYGRWGVNYIYGTWQVLVGLAAVGEDPWQDYIQRGVRWLRSIQRPDGGWGETCETYVQPEAKGQGPSTPSQTAWAILGLLAASGLGADDPAVRRGVNYLLQTQLPEGGWDEKAHTGTGFPGVFYLKYTLYRHYFPLQALGQLRSRIG